jgi:hypothetical protein
VAAAILLLPHFMLSRVMLLLLSFTAVDVCVQPGCRLPGEVIAEQLAAN